MYSWVATMPAALSLNGSMAPDHAEIGNILCTFLGNKY